LQCVEGSAGVESGGIMGKSLKLQIIANNCLKLPDKWLYNVNKMVFKEDLVIV